GRAQLCRLRPAERVPGSLARRSLQSAAQPPPLRSKCEESLLDTRAGTQCATLRAHLAYPWSPAIPTIRSPRILATLPIVRRGSQPDYRDRVLRLTRIGLVRLGFSRLAQLRRIALCLCPKACAKPESRLARLRARAKDDRPRDLLRSPGCQQLVRRSKFP